MIDNLINNDNKKLDIFKKNFKIKIKIDELFLDKLNSLYEFTGILMFNNNEIVNGDFSGNFSNKEKLKFTIKSNKNEKITTLFLDRAKPIVQRYKFIKGFSEGKLDFYSIKKNKESVSKIKIYNFKLKELPVLTKLLTLASLQGIADLLNGEELDLMNLK